MSRFSNNSWISFSLYLFLVCFLFGVRFWKLTEIGFFDYDSARNYQKITAIASANFTDLFHHASPVFNLLYGFLAFLSSNKVFLESFSILLQVAGVFMLAFSFPIKRKAIFITFLGLSFFGVASSRYLSIEPLSLFLFACFVFFYQTQKHKSLSMLLLSLLFLCNYKAIVIIAIIFLFELYHWFATRSVQFFRFILAFLVPIFCVMFLGVILGKSFFQYPATLFHIIWQPQFAQSGAKDFWFYFYFIFDLENSLLLCIPFLLIYLLYKKKLSFTPSQIYFIICFGLYFAFMCCLPKAPRGFVFIFPILYVFTFLLIEKVIHNRVIILFAVFISCTLQLYRVNQHIYQYELSSYKELSAVLKKEKIINLGFWHIPPPYPFIFLKSSHEIREAKDLKEKNIQYILTDCFADIALLPSFAEENYEIIWEGKNQHLLQPMVFLESAEFTGRSYQHCWEAQNKFKKEGCKILLLKKRN